MLHVSAGADLAALECSLILSLQLWMRVGSFSSPSPTLHPTPLFKFLTGRLDASLWADSSRPIIHHQTSNLLPPEQDHPHILLSGGDDNNTNNHNNNNAKCVQHILTLLRSTLSAPKTKNMWTIKEWTTVPTNNKREYRNTKRKLITRTRKETRTRDEVVSCSIVSGYPGQQATASLTNGTKSTTTVRQWQGQWQGQWHAQHPPALPQKSVKFSSFWPSECE